MAFEVKSMITKNQIKFTNNQVLCYLVRLFLGKQATQELLSEKMIHIFLSKNVFELNRANYTRIKFPGALESNIELRENDKYYSKVFIFCPTAKKKYCQLTSTYTFPNLLMKFVIRLCMKPPLAHHKSFRDCEYNFANAKSSLFFSIDRLGI